MLHSMLLYICAAMYICIYDDRDHVMPATSWSHANDNHHDKQLRIVAINMPVRDAKGGGVSGTSFRMAGDERRKLPL